MIEEFSSYSLSRLAESMSQNLNIPFLQPPASHISLIPTQILLLKELLQRLINLIRFLSLHKMSRIHFPHHQILHPRPHQPLLHLRHCNIIPLTRHQQRRDLDMVFFLRHIRLVCCVEVGDLRFIPVERGAVAASVSVLGGEYFVVSGDFGGGDPGGEGLGFAGGEVGAGGVWVAEVFFEGGGVGGEEEGVHACRLGED